MELKWLEDLVCLNEKSSFSRAAEARHVTQSALSRRIKSLEDWVGVALVDRSTYPTTLTPAGEEFRETALTVVHQLYNCREEIRGGQMTEARTLTFAALHTLSISFFPSWIREIENEIGRLNVRLVPEIRTMGSYVTALTEGNCDFLLCLGHPSVPILVDPIKFPYTLLGEEIYIPVTNASAGSKRYYLDGTASGDIPLLRYAPYSFSSHCVNSVLEGHDDQPSFVVFYESSFAEGLKEMLLVSDGIAWLPESLIRRELADGTLARAGKSSWDVVVDIRLYRSIENDKPNVRQLWKVVSS